MVTAKITIPTIEEKAYKEIISYVEQEGVPGGDLAKRRFLTIVSGGKQHKEGYYKNVEIEIDGYAFNSALKKAREMGGGLIDIIFQEDLTLND